MSNNTQIYLATYSNVPVFEFVTLEGPIMRRKLDLWINATHILKIAKFPKAKRTRILEKDVQTGIHEKVQGGYGKYQGTYVPLDLGREIAEQFGVLEVLKPIFDFEYVEGKLETPPPAPKHNHASALNINKKRPAKKVVEEPKKRGRPMKTNGPLLMGAPNINNPIPALHRHDTQPISQPMLRGRLGPLLGSFDLQRFDMQRLSLFPALLSRHDTDADSISLASRQLTQEDLEEVRDDEDDDLNGNNIPNSQTIQPISASPRDSFVKAVHALLIGGIPFTPPVTSGGLVHLLTTSPLPDAKCEPAVPVSTFTAFHENLVNFFANDSKMEVDAQGELIVPASIANPPEPREQIPINAPVDTDGNTIFHWVCLMGLIAELNFLLRTFPHLNINVKNKDGETALMFLVKYNNAYQLKTFPELLTILDSTSLATDNQNRNILHHIISFGCQELRLTQRERVARYYLEEVLDKFSERTDFSQLLNHQDSDGNTPLHIAACSLKKKLIKGFLLYHQLIDFRLKNAMDYSVENYLAAHNHVLRLDSAILENDEIALAMDAKLFESQLYYSKMAMDLQNLTANAITENLTELAYAIDKELLQKDEVIYQVIRDLQQRRQVMLDSQLDVFRLVQVDELIEAADRIKTNGSTSDGIVEFKSEQVLQEEVIRLQNDLCFQYLHAQEELDERLKDYRNNLERFHRSLLNESNDSEDGGSDGDKIELAKTLTESIIKRQQLTSQLIDKQIEVSFRCGDADKENDDDRLQKYFRLILIACDMLVSEVEQLIHLIEQSLANGSGETV
ncbi:KilA-N domain-containing protein [Kocuria palustris]|nr:KilA-N domain-containing protein [Kocuria palustris]